MATLITGADGYLGSRIAASLAGDDLVLAVRARSGSELAGKQARLAHLRAAGGAVTVVPLELPSPAGLGQVEPGSITRIVHAAAVTTFGVDRAIAARVNRDGTAAVIRFAARCDRLERLVLLSTLYSSGLRRGEVHEVRHSDAGFANHYEWSKWAAEELVLGQAGLPGTVLRLPTVIADDGSGTVSQHNAFHHTLKLYYYGLLSLLPGDPATPLSLATAEFTTAAVRAMLTAPPGIYHACSGQIPLGAAVETALAAFADDPAFARRALPPPVTCDRDSFRDLVQAAGALGAGPLGQALASIAPFGEQLYLPKVFRIDRLQAAWPGYRPEAARALVASVSARLAATRWGRREKE